MSVDQYFFDASFLISFIDSTDARHAKAVALYDRIINAHSEIYLSDVLLNEVFTGLGKRCERNRQPADFSRLAHRLYEFVQGLPVLCLYEMFVGCYRDIVALMDQSQGLLSFHDCLIALFLREVPEMHLVTFDRDFERVKGLKILSAD